MGKGRPDAAGVTAGAGGVDMARALSGSLGVANWPVVTLLLTADAIIGSATGVVMTGVASAGAPVNCLGVVSVVVARGMADRDKVSIYLVGRPSYAIFVPSALIALAIGSVASASIITAGYISNIRALVRSTTTFSLLSGC